MAVVAAADKKCNIMQVTPRRRRRRRKEEKEIGKCLRVVVVVLITTLKIGRTRTRRFCLIFDTGKMYHPGAVPYSTNIIGSRVAA